MAGARCVVVRDFDLVRIPFLPLETDAILLINANAVLSLAVTVQSLQPIPGGNAARKVTLVPSPYMLLATTQDRVRRRLQPVARHLSAPHES